MNVPEATSSAAARLIDYLSAEFDRDGVSRTAPDGIQFYYKMPATFAFAGRPDLAEATLRQFMGRFLRSGTLDTAGDAMAVSWAPYLAGWVAWGAALAGRFDLGRRVMAAVADRQRANGGFPVERVEGASTDVQRTGAALMGLAWNNELDRARRAAGFLGRIIADQEGRRFCALVDAHGRPSFDAADRNTFFDVADPFARPAMFATPIAGLVWLYRLTGEREHLESAGRYMDLVLRHERAPELPLATKIGWAALLLQEHTGDERLVRLAADTALSQARRQQPDGSIGFQDMEGGTAQLDKVWLVGWGCDSLLTLLSAPNAFERLGGSDDGYFARPVDAHQAPADR